MEELLRRMLPVGAPIPDEEHLDYSFAVEYHGPPVAYELPKAVPIDVDSIPTAASLAASSVPDRSLVPVIQPVLVPVRYPDLKFGRKPSGIGVELGDVCLVSDNLGSPKSVIVDESAVGLIERDPPCAISLEESDSDSRKKSVELSETGTSSRTGELENVEYRETIGGIEHELDTQKDCSEPQEDPSPETAFFQSDRSGEDINPPDWISTESALSSPFLSSDASSWKAGDQAFACPPCDVKRTSVVTFCVDESDGESSDVVETDAGPVEDPFVNHDRLHASSSGENYRESETRVKKGACHRCLKGNRFTEKEACIVCDAKYCSNCVLRAMGSMPEGRKCIGCIGYPIEESKRESLGKCSRMLRRLLSSLEIQQVKAAEKTCEANQIQPEHVFVNGKRLCFEEMTLLQGCSNPPAKLKPGSYWYDKVSGLWGKGGHKPDKIISPNLNVGGNLMPDASYGNTGVYINGREITKNELRMLQWAGVQCAGNPHFWVNADGSYQEEGQKNIKGHIWNKPGTKLVCSILSLPIPSKISSSSGIEVNNLPNGTMPDYLGQRTLQKLLLVGSHGSGTSTIFKQAKFLYKPTPFSEDERQSIKLMIQTNVYRYLGILLEGRERFEEENLMEIREEDRLLDQSAATGNSGGGDLRNIYSITPRLKDFSDWLLKVIVAGDLEAIFPAATREYAPTVEELWKDAAIQATYSRRSELRILPSVASYFLERVVDISRVDYEPSETDILYAEGITSSNGLASMEFSFPKSTYDESVDTADQHDPFLRYQLVRVHTKGLNGNCKWLEMFEDVHIVVFCVSLSDYDVLCDDGGGTPTNKMLVTKALFESLVSHPSFDQTPFFLILNKFDLLEEKINQTPLTVCEWFHSFNPVTTSHRSSSSINSNSNNGVSLAQQAYHYVAVQFKKLYTSLTGQKLYITQANGWEWKAVDGALRYVREVLKWEEDKAIFCGNEFSAYSTEMSSFSH